MKDKKNIVIRSGSLRMGGLERVLIEVLQNLNLEKYKISLIIEDNSGLENVFEKDIPKEIDLYFLKSEELIKKTHYHREKRKSLYHKLVYNYLMFKEHRLVEKETKKVLKEIAEKNGEIDLFVDYDWGARRYIQNLPLKRKVIWIHNSIPKMLKKPSKIRRFGRNLEKYDSVVTICNEMKDELINTYPNLKSKIVKIYNPFNLSRIATLGDKIDDLNFVEKELIKEKYILAVSRLDINQKDYLTLLKGFALARKNGVEEKLFIVGDGPSRNKIEEYIKDLKLEDSVKLLGQKKNPYVWMKNSRFFVHSSKYEGFGLVLIEAASLGKAIVSSNCEVGPKEILGNGKYGKLFPVGDSNKLKEIIIELLGDEKLLKFYEEKSMERAKDFGVDIVMKEYEELIDA